MSSGHICSFDTLAESAGGMQERFECGLCTSWRQLLRVKYRIRIMLRNVGSRSIFETQQMSVQLRSAVFKQTVEGKNTRS